MGLISPNKNNQLTKEFNKHILGDIIVRKLNESCMDMDGNVCTNAEAVVDRLLMTAKCAESNKDASSAANLLLKYSMGNPAVMQEENKEELPAVKITVSPRSREKLAELASRTEFVEEDNDEGKFIIEDDDGTRIEVDA